MRFIALLTDWILYALLVSCMSIGTIAIHAPGVISAEPTNDLPAMTETQFLDTTPFP